AWGAEMLSTSVTSARVRNRAMSEVWHAVAGMVPLSTGLVSASGGRAGCPRSGAQRHDTDTTVGGTARPLPARGRRVSSEPGGSMRTNASTNGQVRSAPAGAANQGGGGRAGSHGLELPSPAAVRLRRPGWRDPRLLLGVVLVAASVALGSSL